MDQILTAARLAGMIDHSLLRANVTETELAQCCREAAENGFATVAINTAPVGFCAAQLRGTTVGICAAVGFPLGQMPTEVKVFEAAHAVEQGATEIDFVINIGLLKSGRMCELGNELLLVARACGGRITQGILEPCYLTAEEKGLVCDMAVQAGINFVKTSTGMGPKGATIPDVLLMKSRVIGRARVKAAGGIRTLDQALAMIDAGAERIGTSQGLAIMAEARDVLPA
jgi:deoxyribose-phosphate aldolase